MARRTIERRHRAHILLSGAPGTGKTSTVVALAERNRWPLLHLTGAELGTAGAEFQSPLCDIFYLSRRWKCALLLDNLDDFIMNGIEGEASLKRGVSAFFRLFDYYSGLSFFTTHFDLRRYTPTGQKCIKASFNLPPFDAEAALKAWRIQSKKTFAEHQKFIIDGKSIERYAEHHSSTNLHPNKPPWNGKQIDNAFPIAIAIVESDAKKNNQERPVLTRTHFEEITELAQNTR